MHHAKITGLMKTPNIETSILNLKKFNDTIQIRIKRSDGYVYPSLAAAVAAEHVSEWYIRKALDTGCTLNGYYFKRITKEEYENERKY